MRHFKLYKSDWLLIGIVLLLSSHTRCDFNLILKEEVIEKDQTIITNYTVISNGTTESNFNPSTYENFLTCTNGMLKLVEFEEKQYPKIIDFAYYGGESLNASTDLVITASPNASPQPTVYDQNFGEGFSLRTNCNLNPTSNDYFNLIKVRVKDKYEFSFLLNCDKTNRYKKFQIGYLLIGLINAAITIGVALHSKIWSIKFNEDNLSIELTWKKFLLITVVILILGLVLYLIAFKQFKKANEILMYFGIIISFFFTFICFNQTFYLINGFRQSVYKTSLYDIRRCEIVSLMGAIVLLIMAFYVQNWIFYTFLAGCICVGSIKMFYFRSMQQAVYSILISVSSVTLTAIVFHYTLDRSYNDYASELMSPLFIEVPDLVNNLFKKCSWLPVIDIIVPGVFLSYLRTYDENYSARWGGVYTIVGNISFLMGTTAWVAIEALYPFSVPFSLVTYSILMLFICLIAFKRNELKTLWFGSFLQNQNVRIEGLHEDTRRSVGYLMEDELTKNLKIGQSSSFHTDEDSSEKDREGQLHKEEFSEPLYKPPTYSSALRTKKNAQHQIETIGEGEKRSERSSQNTNSARNIRKDSNPYKSSLR